MQPPRPCRGSSRRSSSARWPWSAAKKPPRGPGGQAAQRRRHRRRRTADIRVRGKGGSLQITGGPIKPPGCVVENIRVDLQDANTHLRFLLPYIHCGIDTETY